MSNIVLITLLTVSVIGLLTILARAILRNSARDIHGIILQAVIVMIVALAILGVLLAWTLDQYRTEEDESASVPARNVVAETIIR